LNREAPERSDLVRFAALVETLLVTAERRGEIDARLGTDDHDSA